MPVEMGVAFTGMGVAKDRPEPFLDFRTGFRSAVHHSSNGPANGSHGVLVGADDTLGGDVVGSEESGHGDRFRRGDGQVVKGPLSVHGRGQALFFERVESTAKTNEVSRGGSVEGREVQIFQRRTHPESPHFDRGGWDGLDLGVACFEMQAEVGPGFTGLGTSGEADHRAGCLRDLGASGFGVWGVSDSLLRSGASLFWALAGVSLFPVDSGVSLRVLRMRTGIGRKIVGYKFPHELFREGYFWKKVLANLTAPAHELSRFCAHLD